jgi:hypothetical protein
MGKFLRFLVESRLTSDMKKIREYFEYKGDKDTSDVWSRKPVVEKDVSPTNQIDMDVVSDEEIKKAIHGLSKFAPGEIWPIMDDKEMKFTMEFQQLKGKPMMFVLSMQDGTNYLVNTEGADYARYVSRLLNY